MIVELAAPTTMLAALDPTQHPGWARWLRRAQQRLAGLTTEQQYPGTDHPVTDHPGTDHPGTDHPGTDHPGTDHPGTDHPAGSRADARQRRAGRELDRWTRVRDRHCIGVMCHRPAHHADLDHTIAWLHHGDTVAWNLGTPCRHCHRLKHQGGWTLDQPEPGRFVWHTLLGAHYTVAPRPILDDPPTPLGPPANRRPRPVLDAEPPPPADDDGWIGTGWNNHSQSNDPSSTARPSGPPRHHRPAADPSRNTQPTPTGRTPGTGSDAHEPPF